MAAAPQERDAAGDGQPSPALRLVGAGLELLDLEADQAEIAVIAAVDGLYRPAMERLLEAELDGIEAEPGTDMSRPPG